MKVPTALVSCLLIIHYASCGCPSSSSLPDLYCGRVYEHSHCRGDYHSLRRDRGVRDTWQLSGNLKGRQISSLVVSPGCSMKLFMYKNYRWGVSYNYKKTVHGPTQVTNLSKYEYWHWGWKNWNDEIQSFECTCSRNNWMGRIDNDVNLSNLTIPGTHNTMALHRGGFPFYSAQCQEHDLTKQLEMGIRLLDIRCRHLRRGFPIHHGPVYQRANFNHVLSKTIRFLKQNPSETILMRIMETHTSEGNNGQSFGGTFDSYLSEYQNRFFWTENYMPTLGQARGKIVILRNFWSRKFIDFTSFNIEDRYSISSSSNKLQQVKNHLDAATLNSPVPYVTFSSGLRKFPVINPYGLAMYINPNLKIYFDDSPKIYFGMVFMDFPSEELIGRIISENFFYL